jgi:uridylate kinase
MPKLPPQYSRVLLKFSGEALAGEQGFGLDPLVLKRVASEVKSLVDLGVQVALVVGGGNIFRGASLLDAGLQRPVGDDMGMLATVMNALALQDALSQCAVSAEVLSAVAMPKICQTYSRRAALQQLEQGSVVLFAAGTGNPFFTTDSAAALRAIEINADVVIKGTQVDGIYSADPLKNPQAIRFEQLTFDEVIAKNLQVMDMTAFVLCRDHALPLCIFNMGKSGALLRVICGEPEGSLITG